jgi:hypothetical protein
LYPATAEVLGIQLSATEEATAGVPLPEREIIVGEFVASLATVTLPEMSPVPAGANATLRVAVCPGVKIWPDETPLAVYPAPEMVTFATVTFEFPPLVRVTGKMLLLPILTLEKLRLVLLALRVSAPDPDVADVLGAPAIPVQPEMDRMAKSRRARQATGISFLLMERG